MRTLALVFPDLACELAAYHRETTVGLMQALSLAEPLAVVLAESAAEVTPASCLGGVTRRARRFGVCPGQTVRMARTLVRSLDVRHVRPADLDEALARYAEVAGGVGLTVAVGSPDTVWVQACRAQDPYEEEALLLEATERFRLLGHHVRGAFADGPVLAQALARYAPAPHTVAPAGQGAAAVASLPFPALPLDEAKRRVLLRQGILTVSDLRSHSDTWCQAELGDAWENVRPFLTGYDATSLPEYRPLAHLREIVRWDPGTTGSLDAVLTTLQGLVLRLTARLEGRRRLAVTLQGCYQPTNGAPPLVHDLALSVPTASGGTWLRHLRPWLERAGAGQEFVAVGLTVTRTVPVASPAAANGVAAAVGPGAEAAAVAGFVAQLQERWGEACVGYLCETGAKTLRPVGLRAGAEGQQLALWLDQAPASLPPTRVDPRPAILQGELEPGAFVTVGHMPFRIETVQRQAAPLPGAPRTVRSSYRVRMRAEHGPVEAWVTHDSRRQRYHVAGWYL